jgi:hypothetical protein
MVQKQDAPLNFAALKTAKEMGDNLPTIDSSLPFSLPAC